MPGIKSTTRLVEYSTPSKEKPDEVDSAHEVESFARRVPFEEEVEASASGDMGVDHDTIIESEVKQKREMPSPTSFPIKKEWLQDISRGKARLSKALHLGERYELVLPRENDTTLDTPKGTFGVYKAVIDYGVRFPFHPFIFDILKKFLIGISQLPPTSWQHILTYVATCEIKGMIPSVNAFIHLHVLSKASKCKEGWYALGNRSKCATLIEKDNKVHCWRPEFFFLRASDPQIVHRLNVWNTKPRYIGRVSPFPSLTDDEWVVNEYFSTTYLPVYGKKEPMPANWLPERDFFYESTFLKATGLIQGKDQEQALKDLPKEQKGEMNN